MKKAFCTLLLLCITAVLVLGAPLPASAATSGKVGGCEWSLDGTVLTISGNGPLNVGNGNSPWGKSITELRINEGVTSISVGAFDGYESLYSVTLPSTLKVIEDGAFSNCTSLVSVSISNGLTTIGNYAFSNCVALLDITLPKTVTDVGVELFNECYSLNNIFVDEGNSTYTSVGGVLFSKDMSVLVRYPSNKRGMKYAVPDGVKEISMGAFESAWNLLDITLPDSITKIGFNAFLKTVPFNDSSKVYEGCFYLGSYLIVSKNENMTSCTVRGGTKAIADGAFASAKKLTQVTLPEGLLQIGDSAFSWCSSLKTIYIPKSVTKIADNAFYDCNAIETVFCSGSDVDRSKITIGTLNTSLTNANWKYNSCYDGKDHSFGSSVITKNATCTEEGEKEMTCSVCYAVTTEKIVATGHEYGEWSQTKPSTCVSTGEEERICALCDDVETRTLGVIGHVWTPWTVEIEASCEDVGIEKRSCVLCSSLDAKNIEPTGHTYGESQMVKKPTLTETGLEQVVCEYCGDIEQIPLEKIAPDGYIIGACVGTITAILAVVIVCVIIKKKKARGGFDTV